MDKKAGVKPASQPTSTSRLDAAILAMEASERENKRKIDLVTNNTWKLRKTVKEMKAAIEKETDDEERADLQFTLGRFQKRLDCALKRDRAMEAEEAAAEAEAAAAEAVAAVNRNT